MQDSKKESCCHLQWDRKSQAFCNDSALFLDFLTWLPFYWTFYFPSLLLNWLVQTGRENKKQKQNKKTHRIIVFMILWHQNTWVQECVFRQELCWEGTEKVGSRSLLTVPLLSWVLPCILGQLWPTAVKLLLEKCESPLLFPPIEQGVHFSVFILMGRPL